MDHGKWIIRFHFAFGEMKSRGGWGSHRTLMVVTVGSPHALGSWFRDRQIHLLH